MAGAHRRAGLARARVRLVQTAHRMRRRRALPRVPSASCSPPRTLHLLQRPGGRAAPANRARRIVTSWIQRLHASERRYRQYRALPGRDRGLRPARSTWCSPLSTRSPRALRVPPGARHCLSLLHPDALRVGPLRRLIRPRAGGRAVFLSRRGRVAAPVGPGYRGAGPPLRGHLALVAEAHPSGLRSRRRRHHPPFDVAPLPRRRRAGRFLPWWSRR